MKKVTKAILLFDVMAGLLFWGLYGMQSRTVASDSGIVRIVGGVELELEAEDVKKIAITFDGDVIIGLSQGIC